MDCNQFNKMILDYLDNELDEASKKEFEKHMKECSNCQKEFNSIKKIVEEVNDLPMEELPNGYCKKLHCKLKEALNDKKKIKRNKFIKYVGIAASCLLVFTAVYFMGNIQNKSYDYTADSKKSDGFMLKADSSFEPTESQAADMEDSNNSSRSIANTNEIVANTASGTIDDADNKNSNRAYAEKEIKIIKSGELDFNTIDFDGFVAKLNECIRSNNGYIEYNETYVSYKREDKEYKNANIRVRIPQDTFYNIVNFIKAETEVYNVIINETDVTKEYYDTENQVKNLEIQEQRLRELYDKATTVTEILELENEIRRIRTEIDSYNMNLSEINDRVNMATLNLDITEVEDKNINLSTKNSLWDRAMEGFIDTINDIICFIEGLVVFIIANIPYIIILVAIAFVALRIYKKNKTKNK